MLEGRADIAVHSMKDVPVEFPRPGLVTICERDDPRDAFVSNRYAPGLDNRRPAGNAGNVKFTPSVPAGRHPSDRARSRSLRGVCFGTRLSKLDNGEYDAIILAAAGLKARSWKRIRQPPPPGGPRRRRQARSASNAALMMHGPGDVSASQPYGNGGVACAPSGR